MVRLTDRPKMTLDVYRGRKTATQQQQHAWTTVAQFQRKPSCHKIVSDIIDAATLLPAEHVAIRLNCGGKNAAKSLE